MSGIRAQRGSGTLPHAANVDHDAWLFVVRVDRDADLDIVRRGTAAAAPLIKGFPVLYLWETRHKLAWAGGPIKSWGFPGEDLE